MATPVTVVARTKWVKPIDTVDLALTDVVKDPILTPDWWEWVDVLPFKYVVRYKRPMDFRVVGGVHCRVRGLGFRFTVRIAVKDSERRIVAMFPSPQPNPGGGGLRNVPPFSMDDLSDRESFLEWVKLTWITADDAGDGFLPFRPRAFPKHGYGRGSVSGAIVSRADGEPWRQTTAGTHDAAFERGFVGTHRPGEGADPAGESGDAGPGGDPGGAATGDPE